MANLIKISPEELIEGDLFEQIGLANLSDEKKAEVLAQINQSIEARVLVRLDDMLQNEDRETFKGLIEKDDDKGVMDFLSSKNINLGQLVVEESLLEKAKLIELAQKIKEPKE